MLSNEHVVVTILRGLLAIATPLLALWVGPLYGLIAGVAYVVLTLGAKLSEPAGLYVTSSWWTMLRGVSHPSKRVPVASKSRALGG